MYSTSFPREQSGGLDWSSDTENWTEWVKKHGFWIVIALLLLALAAGVVALVFASIGLADHKGDDDDVVIKADDDDLEAWEEFKHNYSKVYADDEDHDMRRAVFQTNLARINEQNSLQATGATFCPTRFADQTPQEFANEKLMPPQNLTANHALRPVLTRAFNASEAFNPEVAPVSFNYCDVGVCTAVYNQEQCGGCWAFSAAETVEAQWKLSGRPLTALSMQQLIDCDPKSNGCGGGDPTDAYEYLLGFGGLESLATYPFTSADGSKEVCVENASAVVAPIASWHWVSRFFDVREDTMLNATYWYGPLSVCLSAEQWQNYCSGVMTVTQCGTQPPDHCVQLVGWGTDPVDGDYWLLRNSWGDDWGENGFIRIARGDNACGVGNHATLALVPPL